MKVVLKQVPDLEETTLHKYRNLKSINDFNMSQILGVVKQSKIKRDDIHKDLLNVNGYKPNESIIFLLIDLKQNSIYNKNLLDFIDNIIICEDLDIDLTDFLGDEELKIFEKYTHRDLWNYRIKLYKEEFLTIKKKKIKIEEPVNYGFSDSNINSFLNNIPRSLVKKTYDVLQESDPHDIYSYIDIEDININNIQNYDASIFKEGTFLNKLYNIKDEGIGKGEVLIAYLFKDCKINGFSSSFDALFRDGTANEIKSPSNGGSYRFGTKAGIGNYKFFSNILETRKVLKNLFKQFNEEYLKKILGYDLFELSKQFLSRGNFKKERALSSAIDAAEINASSFNLIELWFFLAHTKIWGNYYIDLNTSSPIDQDIFTKEYHNRYGLVNDKEEIINGTLMSLEYVREPLKLKKDIQEEIKRCFDNIDNLVVFEEKNKKISICTSSDEIMMDAISQNGLKVIEKRCRRIDNYKEKALEEWNLDKSSDYYEKYVNLKL